MGKQGQDLPNDRGYRILTSGSVGGHLTALATPMLGGIFAAVAFNLADTYFVGQLGETELAAMGFTFPVATVLTSLALGLGTGLSSVLARAVGAGNTAETRRVTTDGIVLALVVVAFIASIGIATIEPLFRLLGADYTVLPLIENYMRIWYGGMLFLVVPMVGNNAIRAVGNSRLPGLVMIAASIVNIALDPLLIFGLLGLPRLELQGAALATVIARAITLIMALWALGGRMKLLTLERVGLRTVIRSWHRILTIGVPAATTNLIVPITNAIIVAFAAIHGNEAVAGFNVATRIEFLMVVPFYALSAIIGPFVGQNLGAGQRDRIARALRLSAIFCLIWGIATAVILAIIAPWLVSLFNNSEPVVTTASLYLWLVPVSFPGVGMVLVANGALNGLGRPRRAIIIAILRSMAFYIPLAYLGSKLIGVVGIFTAALLANIVAGAVAYNWNMRACTGCSVADAALAQPAARTSDKFL